MYQNSYQKTQRGTSSACPQGAFQVVFWKKMTEQEIQKKKMVQFGTIFRVRLDPYFHYVWLSSATKWCFICDKGRITSLHLYVGLRSSWIFSISNLKFMCFHAQMVPVGALRFSSSFISPSMLCCALGPYGFVTLVCAFVPVHGYLRAC
jgi:hypothetical protein